MRKSHIIKRLNELSTHYNFIHIISSIVLKDFCGPIDYLASRNVREQMNYNEVFFLIGLWLKNVKTSTKAERNDNLLETLTEVYELMEKLHLTFITDLPNNFNDQNIDIYEYFSNGLHFQETMFYSGTGAYDYQYTERVIDKYKYDKEWLQNQKNITLDLIPKFYNSLKLAQEKKLNQFNFNSLEIRKEDVLDIFCLTKSEILNENSAYEGILNNLIYDLSIERNDMFNDIGDFNKFSEKPIIKLEEDNYFIPVLFSVAESIYESPFYWMNNDENHKTKALSNRGQAAEDITYNIVKDVFGFENTISNLIIKKSKSSMVTDIDILAIERDNALIFQVKSKKLTSLSKKGNFDSIKSDFKKAVKDAFNQGIIAADCLKSNNDLLFELKNGDKYTFKHKINNCYIITVVIDNYPAITHQTHILLGKDYDEFPVAINVFDLEIVARYLRKPAEFIDYISRRIKFSKYFKADNELCFLGFHINEGLKKYPNSDLIGLDETWSQFFDKDYYGELSGIREKENKLNKKIGRNELCPCGSGLKYKKCHGRN